MKTKYNVISSCFHKSYWQSLTKVDCLIVRHDADCGYEYEGKAYSMLMDSFAELVIQEGLSCLVVAKPYSRLHGKKAQNHPLVFNRDFYFDYKIAKLFDLIGGKSMAEKFRCKVWLNILKICRPSIVIGIQPDQYLCLTAKVVGIKAFDYQHGVINADHWWYGQKARNDISNEKLPNGFLCWDSISASNLELWTKEKSIEVYVIGNLWFDRFINPKSEDLLGKGVKNELPFKNSDRSVVLVSLQWGLHTHFYTEHDSWIISPALKDTILDTAQKYNWCLRLHPVQMRGTERKVTEDFLKSNFGGLDNVDWYISSEMPLPVILTGVDAHITDSSSVVIEASWFGINSAVLNENTKPGGSLEKLFENEMQQGYAEYVPSNKKDIVEWIEKAVRKKKIKPVLSNRLHERDLFFEKYIKSIKHDRN